MTNVKLHKAHRLGLKNNNNKTFIGHLTDIYIISRTPIKFGDVLKVKIYSKQLIGTQVTLKLYDDDSEAGFGSDTLLNTKVITIASDVMIISIPLTRQMQIKSFRGWKVIPPIVLLKQSIFLDTKVLLKVEDFKLIKMTN